jgi:hypothetical protein
MTPDICGGDEIVELYFYGELTGAEHADAHRHIERCTVCRVSLADLRAIDAALAARRVDAPAGGWDAFTSRLDARLAEVRGGERSEVRAGAAGPWLQIAAALLLVAGGAAGGWMFSRLAPPAVERAAVASPADAAIADAGGSGLDRARLVLAGLAAKDDGAAWGLERDMAARLLPEVALIRQAAALRGRGDLGDILMDVETLLLQASYAETDDPDTLARLRQMIERRDVLMRLSVATAAGEAPYRTRPASLSRPGA